MTFRFTSIRERTRWVYGRLSPAQSAALAPLVRGRVVHDLGAGLCRLSVQLAEMGARRVIALDMFEPPPAVLGKLPAKVTFKLGQFEDEPVKPKTVVLSWPSLSLDYEGPGLMPMIRGASRVVYLGKNRDGIACGGRPLFEHFAERELLAYVPGTTNNLLVLGRWTKGSEYRPLTGEEQDARAEHMAWQDAAE